MSPTQDQHDTSNTTEQQDGVTDEQIAQSAPEVDDEQRAFNEFAQLVDSNDADASTSQASSDEALEDELPDTPDTDASAPPPAAPSQTANANAEQMPVEQLESEYAKVLHENRSHRNRQSQLQVKLNEAEEARQALAKRLEALEAAQSTQSTAAPQSETTSTGSGDAFAFPEQLKQFAEDYPDVASNMQAYTRHAVETAVSRALEAQAAAFEADRTDTKQQLERLQGPVQAIEAQRAEAYRQAQIAALAKEHPDFMEIGADAEFKAWLSEQTPAIQQLNATQSAQDTSQLLYMFKRHRSVMQNAARPPAAPPQRPRSADAAETLPRTGTSRAPSATPESEDAAWDYWAKQANANRI